jgi:glycosyltransferase involved in cell wall biosynthesis
MKSTPHLLLIAYYFPPAGGAGVQRWAKLVKYLIRLGWRVHVVSVRDGCYFATDPTLLADIPAEVEVQRCSSMELERLAWVQRLKRRVGPVDIAVPGSADHSGAPHRTGTLRRLLGHWAHALLRQGRAAVVPDPQLGWVPFAYRAACKVIESQRIDCVVSTSAPLSAHLVGMLLKRRFALPWVADFRDPWAHDPMALRKFATAHTFLEARILKHADQVLCVSQPMVPLLAKNDPRYRDNKYHVVRNGYDVEDFENIEALQAGGQDLAPTDAWRIVCTGSIYGKITLVPFLRALHRLLRHGAAQKVHFLLVGQLDRCAQADFQATISKLQLQDHCVHLPYVPHAQALAHQAAAHLLLLPLYGGEAAYHVASGKLYEYLASGRPILALADPGVAAQAVQHSEAGKVVAPDDVAAIFSALCDLQAGKPGVLPNRSKAAHAFVRSCQRQRQAAAVHTLLQRCAGV